jgi:hypothetical protein
MAQPINLGMLEIGSNVGGLETAMSAEKPNGVLVVLATCHRLGLARR